jgi:hypothetical protein
MPISRTSFQGIEDISTRRALEELFNAFDRLEGRVNKVISPVGVMSAHLPGEIEVQGDLIVRGALKLADGITVKAPEAGLASIFVDKADGDLKVEFSDSFGAVIQADS